MAYHSRFNEGVDRYRQSCGIRLVPLSSSSPTGTVSADGDGEAAMDPVEEAITLYRPNSLFRSFDVRGAGDKLLVYLILFINSCLRRIADRKPAPTKEEARQLLYTLAHDRFALPGEAGFPLGGLMTAPSSKEEADAIRVYLRQCREDAGRRLVERLYGVSGTQPNKFWMGFANRRFMDRVM